MQAIHKPLVTNQRFSCMDDMRLASGSFSCGYFSCAWYVASRDATNTLLYFILHKYQAHT